MYTFEEFSFGTLAPGLLSWGGGGGANFGLHGTKMLGNLYILGLGIGANFLTPLALYPMTPPPAWDNDLQIYCDWRQFFNSHNH